MYTREDLKTDRMLVAILASCMSDLLSDAESIFELSIADDGLHQQQ